MGDPSADVMDVVRILPDVLFRCYKGDDGKIYWSFNEGGLAEEFGLRTEQIKGLSLHELFPGGASPELEEHFELAFQGISTIFTNEIGGRHFRHFPKPIFDDDGKVTEVVGYIAEVTDLIEKERELELTNRELDAFVRTVSHDLRNPLTAMSTLVQIFQEYYKDAVDAAGRQYLEKMLATVTGMHEMTDALLEMSTARNRPLERKEIDLSPIAHDVAQSLQLQEPDRNVIFAIQPDLVADADEPLMRVVLQNLIANAWKYTGDADARIQVGRRETDRGAAFFVQDDGPGFDSDQAGMLFDLFGRAHGAEVEGTGIGLNTVQRIIHRHGGDTWAESAAGEGATFYFTLP